MKNYTFERHELKGSLHVRKQIFTDDLSGRQMIAIPAENSPRLPIAIGTGAFLAPPFLHKKGWKKPFLETRNHHYQPQIILVPV